MLSCCCFKVKQSNVGIVEYCGRYDGVATPGCHCVAPWRRLAGQVSLRLQEMHMRVSNKTKDNVFVVCEVIVQYEIIPDMATSAFYSLESPLKQLECYLLRTVRTNVCKFNLDDLFLARDALTARCKDELDLAVEQFGYSICNVLFVDITTDTQITKVLNDLQVRKYQRVAVVDEAEATRIRLVTMAAAKADAMRLSGEGIAAQRTAIMEGLKGAVEDFHLEVPSVTSEDILSMLLLSQYYDALVDTAAAARPSLVLTYGGLGEIAEQMERGIIHKKIQ